MKSLKEFKESVKIEDANGNLSAEVFDIIKPEPFKPTYNNIEWEDLSEVRRLPNYNKPGNIIQIRLAWRGKAFSIQMFFPSVKKPSRKEVINQMQKVYPGARLWSYDVAEYNSGEPLLQTGD